MVGLMSFFKSNKHDQLHFPFYKNMLIKILIIFIACIAYSTLIAQNNINAIIQKTKTPIGVCVFDIDFTLLCGGASAAVAACKNAGFALAINTSRNEADARAVITDNTLIEKGFPVEFVEIARKQVGSKGPFQFKDSWSFNQPQEQIWQSKSYAMRNIANYYGLKTDDIESRRLILFDDFVHNTIQMQPNYFESYYKGRCKLDRNGLCVSNPDFAASNVSFPRNWKIYRSKWIGPLCTSWYDPMQAAEDAYEMIYNVLYNAER